jgi:hypothetical protein
MARGSDEGGSRESGTRGESWVEKNLGPGWVEVEPGIYEFLLNEVRTKTDLRVAAPIEDEDEHEDVNHPTKPRDDPPS